MTEQANLNQRGYAPPSRAVIDRFARAVCHHLAISDSEVIHGLSDFLEKVFAAYARQLGSEALNALTGTDIEGYAV